MYDERYDNHFRRLQASRDTFAAFAAFANFTLEASRPAAVPKLLRDERPALQTALEAFREGLSGRNTGSGQRQSGTQTENEAFEHLKELVQATDKKLLQPRFYDQPAEKALFYPEKLGGLTQAPKAKRLARFTAYGQQLAAHPASGLGPAQHPANGLYRRHHPQKPGHQSPQGYPLGPGPRCAGPGQCAVADILRRPLRVPPGAG